MFCISAACRSLPRSLTAILWKSQVCSFSISNAVNSSGIQSCGILSAVSPSLLKPASVLLIPTAGMKQKGKLKRRCKHCKFVMIEERLHVWCDEHPRHKQMQAIPKPKTLMKHTCASHGRIRPW